MNPEQQQEILSLREKKLTPKQIARKLGLKVSEVTGFLQAQAEQVAIARAESGELDPVVECLMNTDSVVNFFPDQALQTIHGDDLEEGMAIVTVTRTSGFNRFTVCTYLVDCWCLGVKDAGGPRQFNRSEYEQFAALSYAPFLYGSQKISLAQAQAIVWGAVEYAETLGFKPHVDFEKTKHHLGEWNGELKLEFGRNGKPCYCAGPYDNASSIIHTLNNSVGEGNYDYILGMQDMM
jgi:hypothetical protein